MTTPPPLPQYPLPNYLTPGTVAHVDHQRALRVGSVGAAARIRKLADVAWEYASIADRDSDALLAEEVVGPLLSALQAALNFDRGGWDGGAVSAWAHEVADWVGVEL